MTMKGPPPIAEEATIPCKEAKEALTYAIVGIFICGIILEPIALVKANEAKKLIDADPQLAGSGKVTAARIIAVAALILWVLGVFARIGGLSKL